MLNPSTQSYTLRSESATVEEGSTASFVFTTSPYDSSSVFSYVISGISDADVAGGTPLSGRLMPSERLSIPIAEDGVVEGSETMRVDVLRNGISVAQALTEIIDPYARFSLVPDSPSFDEGGLASFSLVTSNLQADTVFLYQIFGISSEDVQDGKLSGEIYPDSSGVTTLQIPILADQLTEGAETLTVSVVFNYTESSASARINDTSRWSELFRSQGERTFSVPSSFSSSHIERNTGYDLWTITPPEGNAIRVGGYDRVHFLDKSIALDFQGAGGQAYRIYKAAFNREPDHGGLGYWIAQMDAGMSAVEVSARFIDSNEFRIAYGSNPSDALFLTRVYQNVLGRAPEVSGYNWWLNEMSSNPEKSRAKVLADFSESDENKFGVTSLINDGIAFDRYTTPEFRLVSRLFEVDEGQTAIFDFSSVNFDSGTQLNYIISGVQTADILGPLTGSLVVDREGRATIAIQITADKLTEGRETLRVDLNGQSASVIVNDTSVALVGISEPESGGGDGDGGGGGGGGGGGF